MYFFENVLDLGERVAISRHYFPIVQGILDLQLGLTETDTSRQSQVRNVRIFRRSLWFGHVKLYLIVEDVLFIKEIYSLEALIKLICVEFRNFL